MSLQPLREHLIGLPLQTSAFDTLSNALDVLDLTNAAGTTVRLDQDATLLVDKEAIAAAVAPRLAGGDVGWLTALTVRVDAVVRNLRTARSRGASNGEHHSAIAAIGQALRAFVPLPIVGKTVAGELHAALAATGWRGPLPTPHPVPGVRLTVDLVALGQTCRNAGTPPDVVAASWPEVPPEVRRLVDQFASDHLGFGPLPWEAPGFDDPAFVAARLATITHGVRPAPDSPRDRTPPPTSPHQAALHAALAAWLDVTETGLIEIRRAFHGGIRRLLPGVAADAGVDPIDLLFATFDEVAEDLPPSQVMAARRGNYLAHHDYLVAHGIDDRSLERLGAPA